MEQGEICVERGAILSGVEILTGPLRSHALVMTVICREIFHTHHILYHTTVTNSKYTEEESETERENDYRGGCLCEDKPI